MSQTIKTIFIGTPDFGAPSLHNLINDKTFDIVSVITQPDKKIGRKQELTAPVIKQIALKNNLPVLQPNKIADITDQIKQLSPDLIIVIAYAQIIPKKILDIPKYGTINVHGSLLPKYRGASCIQAAILNGDKETGVTIMKMDENLDTGPILLKSKILIDNTDTAETLFEKLSELGASILIPAIKDHINNKLQAIPQDNAKSSYVGMLKKSDGRIDWSKSAIEVERFIRAMHSWPGAFSYITQHITHNTQHATCNMKQIDNLTVKIIKTASSPISINKYESGTIFVENNNLYVQCKIDSLQILNLQISGKKIMTAQEFINGHSKYIGQILQ